MKCLKPKFYDLENKTWKNKENNNCIKICCGNCIACLTKKKNFWKHKLLLENLNYIKKEGYFYFITLTFNQQNLEKIEEDNSKEFQKWIKRIRRIDKNNKIKYFATTELGSKNLRLHYHIILFSEKDILPKTTKGKNLEGHWYYTNPKIKWKNGFHTINSTKLNNIKDYKKQQPIIEYVIKYILKNPIKYFYSKKLGYDQIEKLKNSDSTYIFEKNVIKLPNYKNYLSTKEILKNNKIVWQNKKNWIPKEYKILNKEIKEL